MKQIGKSSLFSVPSVQLVLSIFLSQSRAALGQEQDVQVIELTAKKYEYSPSPVQVKAGTKVRLKITAVDHDHGFQNRNGSRWCGTGREVWAGFCFATRLLAAKKG